MARKMTARRIERLAMDIRRFLLDKEMWIDVTIFFNGKAVSTMSREHVSGHYEFGYNDETKLFVWENVDPKAYMEYCGGILSMTFEGPFHHALHYGTAPKVEKEFRELLAKYGCYMERGDHWNLSVFQG